MTDQAVGDVVTVLIMLAGGAVIVFPTFLLFFAIAKPFVKANPSLFIDSRTPEERQQDDKAGAIASAEHDRRIMEEQQRADERLAERLNRNAQEALYESLKQQADNKG